MWIQKLEQMDYDRLPSLVKTVYEEVVGRDQEGDQESDSIKILSSS